MNKQIFFGQYKRIASYFEGTELAATGLPTGRELELLETVRDKVPPELFKKPYTNPVNGTPEEIRDNLREARAPVQSGGLRSARPANGQRQDRRAIRGRISRRRSEFRARLPVLQAVARPPRHAASTVRTVDEAQYENRLRNWDFDIMTSAGPNRCRPATSSAAIGARRRPISRARDNIVGIKNPAVDAMIDQVIFAKNRPDLEAATNALDRILLWNFYVVPQWTYGKVRTARWDRFGHPDPMPKYGRAAFPTVWWWDAEKAAKTG